MAIMFPELSKNTVHIGLDGGKWCEVKMLTLAQFNVFQKIQADLATLGEREMSTERRVDAIVEAREKLAELACSVMPPELCDRVRMFDYKQLAALVNALCTGKDDSEKDAPEKKVTFPSQMST